MPSGERQGNPHEKHLLRCRNCTQHRAAGGSAGTGGQFLASDDGGDCDGADQSLATGIYCYSFEGCGLETVRDLDFFCSRGHEYRS